MFRTCTLSFPGPSWALSTGEAGGISSPLARLLLVLCGESWAAQPAEVQSRVVSEWRMVAWVWLSLRERIWLLGSWVFILCCAGMLPCSTTDNVSSVDTSPDSSPVWPAPVDGPLGIQLYNSQFALTTTC